MNTTNTAADITVPQILAGLLPVISDKVKQYESAEAAMQGVQAVYETTTISEAIKFSQIRDTVKNMAHAVADYYQAIGVFKPQLRLVA